MHSEQAWYLVAVNKYFELNNSFELKNLWGCRSNSKFLFPSVTALSLTIGKHDIVSGNEGGREGGR